MDSSFDEVLEFNLDYEVDGESYDVTVRIVSKMETDENLVQEVCDVMTVPKAVSRSGETYDHESWRELLSWLDAEQEFWETAVEKFVMIQICLKTMEPGNA